MFDISYLNSECLLYIYPIEKQYEYSCRLIPKFYFIFILQ